MLSARKDNVGTLTSSSTNSFELRAIFSQTSLPLICKKIYNLIWVRLYNYGKLIAWWVAVLGNEMKFLLWLKALKQ